MQNICDNLYQLHHNLADYCQKSGRLESEVTLLCVSKTKPLEMIIEAYNQGERHFGESYALEAVEKITKLKENGYNDIVWHFIGPIQSNKTKHIAAHFDLVESVDRIKILDRLNEQRPDDFPPLKVLIQVNISHEEQKQGCEYEEVPSLLEHARNLSKLEVVGLMGVGRADASEEELATSFEQLHTFLQSLQGTYPKLQVLSLGMTHDAQIAIAHGSTEVRIGSFIFGERDYSKHH